MAEFEFTVPNDMVQLATANAPTGLATCPNCTRRYPAAEFNGAGGDFWYCSAPVALPEFAGVWLSGNMTNHLGNPINLKLFDPASTYAGGLNARSCALFASAA